MVSSGQFGPALMVIFEKMSTGDSDTQCVIAR